jgi:hypothetical protein
MTPDPLVIPPAILARMNEDKQRPAYIKAFREMLQTLAASEPDPVVKNYCAELLESHRTSNAQLVRLRNAALNTSLSQAARLRAIDVLARIFDRKK